MLARRLAYSKHFRVTNHHRPFPDVGLAALNDRIFDASVFHIDRTGRGANSFRAPNSSGIASVADALCNAPMGGPSRRRIFGDRVRGAKISAEHARERARDAVRKADAAECLLWSEQME